MAKSKAPKTGDKSPSRTAKVNTTAHLINTAGHHLAHTQRHLKKLVKGGGTSKEQALDKDHAMTHLNGGLEHVQKLMSHMKSNYPAEGSELQHLEDTIPLSTRVQQAHQAAKRRK